MPPKKDRDKLCSYKSESKKYLFRNRVKVEPGEKYKSALKGPELCNARLTTPWSNTYPSLQHPEDAKEHSNMYIVDKEQQKTLRWIGTLSKEEVHQLFQKWQDEGIDGLVPRAEMEKKIAPGLKYPNAGELLMAVLLRRAALPIPEAA